MRPTEVNSRTASGCLGMLVFYMAANCFAQESVSPIETRVEPGGDVEPGLSSLKRVLQIRSLTASFQLAQEANTFRLRLDFYRGQKPVTVAVRRPEVGGPQGRHYGKFDVQIIDLDYLRLGDAPAGHCRFFVSLMTSEQPNGRGTMSFGEFDVSKAAFDARPRSGATGCFEDFKLGGDGSIPLFYSASGQAQHAGSLTELLDANPEADILVGVLETR